MIDAESRKEVTLIIASPDWEAIRYCFFKLNTCSLYNIQSPYSKVNYIKHLQENNTFFYADFSKIKTKHYKKFSKQRLLNDIKKDPNSNIVIFSVVPSKLKNLGSKLKNVATKNNKQIIVCLFVRGINQERLNYQITLTYLQRLKISLSDYSNVYWVFSEFYHSQDYNLETDRTWVKDLKGDRVEYL